MPETRTESEPTPSPTPSVSELDEVLWQAWKAMELPEGYRAEIIEGAIEVSPTGRYSHSEIIYQLKEALGEFLRVGTSPPGTTRTSFTTAARGCPTCSSRSGIRSAT